MSLSARVHVSGWTVWACLQACVCRAGLMVLDAHLDDTVCSGQAVTSNELVCACPAGPMVLDARLDELLDAQADLIACKLF